MIFKIRAQAYKRGTDEKIGEERVEVIDTKRNRLFANVKTLDECKARFLQFWNELNAHSYEVVRIIDIE